MGSDKTQYGADEVFEMRDHHCLHHLLPSGGNVLFMSLNRLIVFT